MKTVLVVDDSAVSRRMLAGLLSELELDPILAEDGETGLNLLRQRQPDCVLLDWNMPGMDGLSFLDALRGTHPDLPVVMVTSESDLEHIATALKRGASEYIMKPFDLESLRTKLSLVQVLH